MLRTTLGLFVLPASAALLIGCDDHRAPVEPSYGSVALARASKGTTELATLTKLPSLGSNSEALAVDESGSVIVGHSFDRAGRLYAVKWTWQSGSWVISTLPYPGSARATGVDNQGGAAGYFASIPQKAVLWPVGSEARVLGCASDVGQSTASGISADGQVVVGSGGIWRTATPGSCGENLPALAEGGGSSAVTVNGDGTIVGGSSTPNPSADPLPVRWRSTGGQWQVEQLDTRRGRASGANAAGDLAGFVAEPCTVDGGCQRAVVWYAAGGSLDLGRLGADRSNGTDINSGGEVVGVSTANGRSTAFFWSSSLGVRPLAAKGSDAVARAVSNVRSDGTRLVVGMAGDSAAVWVVRNP